MRFLVTHPPDPRPALVVDTVARADSAAVMSLKEALLRAGCPNGLLFDGSECVIVRDTYASLGVDSLQEDARVPAESLLARVGGGRDLELRVFEWLRSMAQSWNDALPSEPGVSSPFITDIVPAVAGSSIRRVA